MHGFHELITTLVFLQVDRDDITTGMSISVSEGEGMSLQYSLPCLLILIVCVYTGSLNATIGNDSTLAPDEIASGFLPFSLFEMFGPDEESIPIVFAVLRSGSLFSIEGNQGDVEGLETSVGSPVVSLTAGVNRTFINLPDPVIVNVRILVPVYKQSAHRKAFDFLSLCSIQNFTNPRCVSYDFDQQGIYTISLILPISDQRKQRSPDTHISPTLAI